MQDPAAPPDIFDRRRRALRRGRHHGPGADIVGDAIRAVLMERLDDVVRPFNDALLIGGRDTALIDALRAKVGSLSIFEPNAAIAARVGAMTGDEDRLPVEPESLDLIVWPGGLESINDVPGALLRCRLALRPDGLLLGAFTGDGSWPLLRDLLRDADAGQPAARMHPQIDVRAAGDLLARTGFAMPVADVEALHLRYRSVAALVADVRAAAQTNVLVDAGQPVTRAWRLALGHAFAARADAAGRCDEIVRIVHVSGWAPHPDQARPARRGSAKVSLATALGRSPPPQPDRPLAGQ